MCSGKILTKALNKKWPDKMNDQHWLHKWQGTRVTLKVPVQKLHTDIERQESQNLSIGSRICHKVANRFGRAEKYLRMHLDRCASSCSIILLKYRLSLCSCEERVESLHSVEFTDLVIGLAAFGEPLPLNLPLLALQMEDKRTFLQTMHFQTWRLLTDDENSRKCHALLLWVHHQVPSISAMSKHPGRICSNKSKHASCGNQIWLEVRITTFL